MDYIYSKNINIYILLILNFLTLDLVATTPIDYEVTDTVYLNGVGLINVDVSTYLPSFQNLNSGITSLEDLSVSEFTCENSTEVIPVQLFSGTDTLQGALNLTILDTISPFLNLHQNTTLYLNENGEIDNLWEEINNNSKDNCSYQVTLTPAVFNCEDIGLQQVVVSIYDEAGNTEVDSTFINIIDNSAPTIVVNSVIAYLDELGSATISIHDLDGGSYDNCDNTFNLELSDSVFTYADIGINTVLFTLSNTHGESSSINATIEVKDTLPPVINSQNLTLYLDNNGELIVTASMFNNGTTDNSLLYTLSINDAFFTCDNIGINTLELTAVDNYNNISVELVTLDVKDHIDPVAITEDIILVLDGLGQAILDPEEFDNGSYDNCSITKTVSVSEFNCNDIGTHTVFLNVTDASGNFNTALGNVTIVDNTAPTAITQAYTIELDHSGFGVISAEDLDNGSYDNCSSIDEYAVSQSSFNCSDLGSNSVVFGVSDEYGNTSTVTSSIQVIDLLPPTLVLQDINADLDSNGNYFLNEDDINIGTFDNCTGSLTYTYSNAVLTGSNLGGNFVEVYVTDESGNVASDEIVVTIEDHITPKLNLSIPDQLAYSESNFCGAFVTFPTPSFEDNSGVFTVAYSHVNGSFFGLGNTSVYYTATDGSGNATVDSFSVVVLDNTPPEVIHTITNYTFNANGVVEWDSNQMVFSDNCSDQFIIELSHHSLDTFNIGTTIVTGTVTDEFNNTSAFSFPIVVDDIVNPVFVSVPNDIEIYLTSVDGCERIVDYDLAQAEDNHSETTINYSIISGTTLNVGSHVVNVLASDEAGNTVSHMFNITIIDTISPVFTSVPQTIHTGACNNNVSYIEPTVEDNCTIASLYRTSGLASGSIFPIGIHQIVYLATDIHGNSTEVSFEVNVEYIEPPYIPSVKIGCTELEPFNLVDEGDNIQFFGLGVEDGKFNPALVQSGIYTVEWTWEDSFGCETDGTIEVIINDTPITPEIEQPDMFQLSVHNGYSSYQWYKNGILLEGETNRDLEIFDGGNYEVIVGNESNCTALSQIYNIGGGVFGSLDINEIKAEGFVVYPNPAQDYIILTTTEQVNNSTIKCYNVLGQNYDITQLENLNNYQVKLDISHLPSGIYEFSLESVSGMVTKKIIIQ